MADSFLEKRISSANLYRSAAGSVPTDKTKMSGVVGEESLNTRERSEVCRTNSEKLELHRCGGTSANENNEENSLI